MSLELGVQGGGLSLLDRRGDSTANGKDHGKQCCVQHDGGTKSLLENQVQGQAKIDAQQS